MAKPETPLAVVTKAQAKSNPNLDYIPPAKLHQGREDINAHLTFIKRQSCDNTASLKIWKTSKDGTEKPEASITLNDAAINELAKYLAQVDAFKPAQTGQYLLVPYNGHKLDLKGKSPKAATKALLGALTNPDLANQIFTADIPTDLAQTLQYAARAAKMRDALAELNKLMADNTTSEQQFQKWLEEYAWVLGTQYIPIRAIDRTHKLDALVKGVSGFCDVIELKRANMDVLTWDASHKGYYFSKDVTAAIGQTITYLERLHEAARRGLEDAEHIKAFYPHGTIVIGRSTNWSEAQHKALQAHNGHLQRIRVITFDHLLSIGQNILKTILPEQQEAPTSNL